MKCKENCAACCKDSIVRFFRDEFAELKALVPKMSIAPDYEDELNVAFKTCPFLSGFKCAIYEHRPEFCRAFPVFNLHESEKPMMSTSCPNFDTVTLKDIAEARKCFARYYGRLVRLKKRFVLKHSAHEFQKLNGKLIEFVEKMDGSEFDFCIQFDVAEYVEKLKDPRVFKSWVLQKRAEAGKLNADRGVID
jgi:Fe-S-cluster containining protein